MMGKSFKVRCPRDPPGKDERLWDDGALFLLWPRNGSRDRTTLLSPIELGGFGFDAHISFNSRQ